MMKFTSGFCGAAAGVAAILSSIAIPAMAQPAPGYQAPNQGYSAPMQGYQAPNQGYQAPNQGYQAPNQGYQPNQGYPAPNQGYQAQAPGPDQQLEARVADLYRRMQITPDEMPLWNAFATVMRQNARQMAQKFAADRPSGNVTALHSMELYSDLAESHARDMERLVPAFRALYQAMPPAQQRVTDQAFRSYSAPPPGQAGQ